MNILRIWLKRFLNEQAEAPKGEPIRFSLLKNGCLKLQRMSAIQSNAMVSMTLSILGRETCTQKMREASINTSLITKAINRKALPSNTKSCLHSTKGWHGSPERFSKLLTCTIFVDGPTNR